MRTKQLSLTIILLTLLFMTITIHSLANGPKAKTLETESTGPYLIIEIQTAYYTNLDDDNYDDDVYALVHVEVDGYNTCNIDYYVNLTLPSGTSYVYRVMITTQTTSFDLQNLFYNHAIESGYYTLTVTAILLNGVSALDEHVYVFDPPGSSDFGDPTFDLI